MVAKQSFAYKMQRAALPPLNASPCQGRCRQSRRKGSYIMQRAALPPPFFSLLFSFFFASVASNSAAASLGDLSPTSWQSRLSLARETADFKKCHQSFLFLIPNTAMRILLNALGLFQTTICIALTLTLSILIQYLIPLTSVIKAQAIPFAACTTQAPCQRRWQG